MENLNVGKLFLTARNINLPFADDTNNIFLKWKYWFSEFSHIDWKRKIDIYGQQNGQIGQNISAQRIFQKFIISLLLISKWKELYDNECFLGD